MTRVLKHATDYGAADLTDAAAQSKKQKWLRRHGEWSLHAGKVGCMDNYVSVYDRWLQYTTTAPGRDDVA